MEKRFYWGVILLLLLLALGIFTAAAMERACAPIARQLELASQKAISGETAQAISLAEQAKADWAASRQAMATVADHTPIDEIEGLFAEMDVYAKTGETVHLGACCAQLSVLVQAMAEAHAFAWWNLL